jgi:hypothetical protein
MVIIHTALNQRQNPGLFRWTQLGSYCYGYNNCIFLLSPIDILLQSNLVEIKTDAGIHLCTSLRQEHCFGCYSSGVGSCRGLYFTLLTIIPLTSWVRETTGDSGTCQELILFQLHTRKMEK